MHSPSAHGQSAGRGYGHFLLSLQGEFPQATDFVASFAEVADGSCTEHSQHASRVMNCTRSVAGSPFENLSTAREPLSLRQFSQQQVAVQGCPLDYSKGKGPYVAPLNPQRIERDTEVTSDTCLLAHPPQAPLQFHLVVHVFGPSGPRVLPGSPSAVLSGYLQNPACPCTLSKHKDFQSSRYGDENFPDDSSAQAFPSSPSTCLGVPVSGQLASIAPDDCLVGLPEAPPA